MGAWARRRSRSTSTRVEASLPLRFLGASGTGYDLSLLDEKSLVGTATLTAGQAGQFERERPVKLEKKE